MFSTTTWQRIYDSPTLTITIAKAVERDDADSVEDDDVKSPEREAWDRERKAA